MADRDCDIWDQTDTAFIADQLHLVFAYTVSQIGSLLAIGELRLPTRSQHCELFLPSLNWLDGVCTAKE